MDRDTLRVVLALGGVALVILLLILGWRIVAVSIGPVKVELEAPDDSLGASESRTGSNVDSPVSVSLDVTLTLI